MAKVFVNSQYCGFNGNTVIVDKIAPSMGVAFDIPTRGRLSGTIFMTGQPSGVAYGLSEYKVYPESILYKITKYFGEASIIYDGIASVKLPPYGESPDFKASNPYYLDTLGQVADVAMSTLNTLAGLGAITAFVTGVGAPAGGALMLAKSALPLINKYVAGAVASGVISSSAKAGSAMLSESGLGKGIEITPSKPYLICLADIEAPTSTISDESGGAPVSGSSGPKYVSQGNSSYDSYDKTADYNNQADKTRNGVPPVRTALNEIIINAWAEAKSSIEQASTDSGVPLSTNNDDWKDAQDRFADVFTEALSDIITNAHSDFNGNKLKLDELRNSAELVDQANKLKDEVQKSNEQKEDDTAQSQSMTFQNWVKLFNRYFQKRNANTIMALLEGEVKADILKDNNNVAETTDLYIPVQGWGSGDELL